MENRLSNMEDILNRSVSGFHRYVLSDPVHLDYVSRNLCDMVGFGEEELLSGKRDLYATLVHPADRELYDGFIRKLRTGEQTLSLEYRLRKKDGAVLYVKDTVTVSRQPGGVLTGCSVLTDITEIRRENSNLLFLNETTPCGFLKYTCEKQPRITYINRTMMDFLRLPEPREGEMDYLEMYRNNVLLMLPMEERRRFALYIRRLPANGTPVTGELTVLRCDGTRAYLFGWVTKCVNEQGEEEYQSACMDITERHQIVKERTMKRYLKALTDIYGKIFEFDLSNGIVKCLYARNSPMFRWIENIPMQMGEATEKWIVGTVVKEDRDRVLAFFQDFENKKLYKSSTRPPQITYRAHSSSGEVRLYGGIFLKMDGSVSLYCCRALPDMQEADSLKSENLALKENMQELVMRFREGIAAFEISGENVTPLYASENVCTFFGFSREEWLPYMAKSTPIREFTARSEVAYTEFASLFRNGEAEFSYYDVGTDRRRRIKAICSPRSPGVSPRYVLLYNVDDSAVLPASELTGRDTVSVRTFGYFDVFVGEKPIAFRSQKSKELFALLVDRRGGFVSSEEAISFLWEDEPVSPVTLARYRKVALRLKNILEEYGISDVVESVDGKRRIVPERVQCDLYDYLTGREEYAQLFKGSYLTNYSWGEKTLAELTGKILY